MAQPGDVVADRFVLERLAGSGGMAAVYHARDRETDQSIALKILWKVRGDGPAGSAFERFEREADLLRTLQHPGIVRYVAHGATAAGEPFLAMEWLDGEDLHTRLARGPLSVEETIGLAAGVANALAAAHARGVVHRDVKPSNLFLPGVETGHVKVLDFGIAHGSDLEHLTTKTGTILGTLGYMAPEQVRGSRDIDARVDVFSLGCVLLECLTGSPAFAGEHVPAVLAKILFEDAPRIRDARRDVPVAFERIVERMLSKEREGRPADGGALAAELAALVDAAASRPQPSLRAPSLTSGEQRLLCVVLALGPPRTVNPAAATLVAEERSVQAAASEATAHATRLGRLRESVRAFDGHVEWLLDGSIVTTLAGLGAATDQATRAAQCALALRELLPEASMALATGLGEVTGRLPVGTVTDRAARLARVAGQSSKARGVWLDEVTAGLLDARFEVSFGAQGIELLREQAVVDRTRRLLGRTTPCVGRERELSLLSGIFEECLAEKAPRVALVTAPAGIGKSRLRFELVQKLNARGEPLEVWTARGDARSAGAPFVLLAPLLRRVAGLLDGEPIESRRRKLASRVARYVAEEDRQRVAEFLGELVGAPFAGEPSVALRAARQDAMLMGDQMRRAWEDFVAAECSAHPLLVVLEDLHWGDSPSVAYFDGALSVAKDGAWMVLALARPEVAERFPSLWAAHGVTHWPLGPLSVRASERLVGEVLGDGIGRATLERVVKEAAGNAFYLEELIRAVAEGKGQALPGTVLAMVQARLEALDSEARRALRAASILGTVFWAGAVAALLDIDRGRLRALLDRLVELELVLPSATCTFPGETEYCFRHAVVCEAAYAMLTDEDRALGHRLAGEWLEAAGSSHVIVIAEHFERAGESARAIGWYQRAAEEALSGNDFDAAIARASRAAGCGATGETLGALSVVCCDAYAWKGEHAESLAAAERAMLLFPRGSQAWFQAMGRMLLECRRLGRVEAATVAVQVLLDAWAEDAPPAAIIAACQAADTALLLGSRRLGETLLDRIEERVRRDEALEPIVFGHVHRARALRAQLSDGDPSGLATWLARSVEAFERAGDIRSACIQRANFGYGLMLVGDYENSEVELRVAMAAARRLGLRTLVSVCEHNLGAVLGLCGRSEEGRRVIASAIGEFGRSGDRRLEAAAHAYLAELLLSDGDVRVALSEAERAVTLADDIAPSLAQALGVLARVQLAIGDAGAARAAASEARALLDRLGGLDRSELVDLVFAEALFAAGEREPGKAAMARARDRLLSRAGRIADGRWRASFVERRSECARILERAAAWAAPEP